MTLREFDDAEGTAWRVWSTRPTNERVVGVLRDGWLTFERDGERRRLAPIPDRWPEQTDDEIRALWNDATPVARAWYSWRGASAVGGASR